MFWADKASDAIRQRYREKILTGDPLIVRDEKTLSGRVHVGSLRGVAIHGIINEILQERNVPSKFLFEINDFDPMDDCPPELQKTHAEHMGKPLFAVPSPDGLAKNYPEYFGSEFMKVIDRMGFEVEYYRLSDAYREGKFNETIRLALLGADKIREIYREISGSEKADDWLPVNVICPKCGKIGTTKVSDFDKETVAFECRDVDWAKGCGETGRTSPFDGNGKLVWKVEWAAKWKVFGVDIEGAGKDHSTKGGSRDTAVAIANQIFDIPNPFDIPYEFFVVAGKKMSSSKGRGASAKEISDLLPTKIARLLFFRKEAKKPIDFEPDGETIPNLFDEYDRLQEAFFSGDTKRADFARIFELCHIPQERVFLKNEFRPRFREISFLSQLPHVDLLAKVAEMKGSELTEGEKEETRLRVQFAEKWIEECAPERYIFKISDELPEAGKDLSVPEKEMLSKILEFFEKNAEPTGEDVHGFLHDLKRELDINPREIFSPLYRVFLGKDSGPKAGWLLSVLGGECVKKRIKEAITEKNHFTRA